ncbi:transmembrane domain-containing protein [Durotheca rogersii]|uniref:transmembrane domain-containing protein n=1 Tax=Durotheca rogersii TaxID=419775 RepID=UPI002220D095|nr:transmembrane domain-containing protein [Durotheca rogersii]KAI5862064.1 transmembrane domain-containing protein [Durotheca rogersii]
MDDLRAYLPPAKGYLPYYMFGLSILAVGNSLQNYLTLHYSRRLYNGQFVPNSSLPKKTASFDPEDSTRKLVSTSATTFSSKGARTQDQVTPLAARLFGTYTLISAIVRIYASYNLHLAPVYNIALWTYAVALVHFGSEWAIYRSARLGAPILFPFFFASVGIVWMVSQYNFYVEA